jgi:uncharacterized protein (TIGR02996 family)
MSDSHERAFLAAITGGDDTARLVFADWLQERSDPRAAWVRDPEIWPFMAPDATDPVPRLLTKVDGEIPWENREVLARLGLEGVPALITALKGKCHIVRCGAAGALGDIGPIAAEAIPALTQIAREDPHERVRLTASEALRCIENPNSDSPADTKAP